MSPPSSSQSARKKKPGLMIAIGIPKGGPSDDSTSNGPDPQSKPPSPAPMGGGIPPPVHPRDLAATSPDPLAAVGAGGGGGGQGQESTTGKAVPPHAVAYHTAAENCGACEYMGPDGNCSWLKMPVQHGDHCLLFEQKGGMEPDSDDLGAMGQGHPAPPAGMPPV